MKNTFEINVDGKTVFIETGEIAKQASGSVIVKCEDTIVLVTVVADKKEKEEISFTPLTVEYQEKIYSAGRIPGNYFRREGRPSEKETLTARLIDRPIRPLFPKGYAFETQVVATVLSMDQKNEPDVLAMIGASCALSISDIPFDGPIACGRVIRKDGKFILNPPISDFADSDINIVVAGSKTGVVMVEGFANELSEDEVIDAIFFAHEKIQPLIEIQETMQKELGRTKRIIKEKEVNKELEEKIFNDSIENIKKALDIPDKEPRKDKISAIKALLIEKYPDDNPKEIDELFSDIFKKESRRQIVEDGKRIGGRAFDEIRPITCRIGVLPRSHGSALFTRGETQVLGVLTIGSGRDEQRVETLSGEENRQFMLHYNFPAFSVGETKRMMGPSRRDIGHGHLAEKAISVVLPSNENGAFDYTIRLVSEVMESNGSSSMGTVCSCSLALMDGGVPVKSHVSGIAMGLIKEGDNVVILSDILGDEDHFGDMDFKVAGTPKGINAIQMDIKIKELDKAIMQKALIQAKAGRLFILDKMIETIDIPRSDISEYAPRITTVKINPDKIREIIGQGGKVIRGIQAETNTTIEIDPEGLVKIVAYNKEEAMSAKKIVEDIAADPEEGDIFMGKVTKTTDFGAFVELKKGVDGLVHISELANHRVKDVTDVVKVGDEIKVKVIEVTKEGRVRLTYKGVEN